MSELIKKIKNTRDYENLKERLGDDLGQLIYDLVEQSEKNEEKSKSYCLFFMNVMDGADPDSEAKSLGLI
jgi:hypothetical protein